VGLEAHDPVETRQAEGDGEHDDERDGPSHQVPRVRVIGADVVAAGR